MGCRTSIGEFKLDIIPHGPFEYLILCAVVENDLLAVSLNLLGDSIPEDEHKLVSLVKYKFKLETLNTTISLLKENIDPINQLRGIRLDIHAKLSSDFMFYYQGKYPANSILIYNNSIGVMKVFSMGVRLLDVQVIRNQFLYFVVHDELAGYPNSNYKTSMNKTTGYLYEYKHRSISFRHLKEWHPLDDLSACFEAPGNKISDCKPLFKVDSGRFVHDFFVADQEQVFIEFLSVETTTKLNETNKFIDVYRFDKLSLQFEKFIHGWEELVSSNAFRFSCPEFFLQVQIIDSPVQNRSIVSVYMSPRRYKSRPKNVFTFEDILPQPRHAFFDENSKMLFIMGRSISYRLNLLEVRLKINFTLDCENNFLSNSYPNGTKERNPNLNVEKSEDSLVKRPPWVSTYCDHIAQFHILIQKKNVSHYFCINTKLKMGNYFFQASGISIDQNSQNNTGSIFETLAEGLSREVDLSEIFKGSFLKIVPSQLNPLSEITDSYLDKTSFKIPKIRQLSYLESLYGIETKLGDVKKVIFSVSTRNDNLFVSGSRYQPSIGPSDIAFVPLLDFRALITLYPVNETHAVVQVEDNTYMIHLNNIRANRSLQTQQSDLEIPSKGINGVCKNSTIIRHNRLGKLMVCFSEGTAYVKNLDRDEPIIRLKEGEKEKRILKDYGNICFIKSSDLFANYVFFFYKEKLDPTRPPVALNDTPPEEVLHMAVFTVANYMDPRIVLVNKFSFKKDEPNFLGLEIAGEKLVVLYKTSATNSANAKPNNGSPTPTTSLTESRVRVFSIQNDLTAIALYDVVVPDRLALPNEPQLVLTDLISEVDEDNNLNTVINSQSKMYQTADRLHVAHRATARLPDPRDRTALQDHSEQSLQNTGNHRHQHR